MNKKKIMKYIGLSMLLFTMIFIPRVSAAGFKYANQYIQCGELELPYGVAYIVGNVVNIIKIAIPILLIVMGMLDFLQAVISNDEKQMKEKTNKFIKRIIAAIIIFFVVAIVQFVFGQVISGDSGKDALSCVSCFIGNDNSCTIVEKVGDKTGEYIPIKNNDTGCDLTYSFYPANMSDSTMTIKFWTKNCKFKTVTNTSCKWEDENGGDILTGTCNFEEMSEVEDKYAVFTTGANFTSVDATFKIEFENEKSTTVTFSGNPYSVIEGEEK